MFGVTLLVVDEWYERWFGGLLEPGTVAQLGYARQLMLVPVAIVGQALAAAALPFMARLWSEGRRVELDALVLRTLRVGVAIAVVAAGALFALAEPTVAVVYQRGRFSSGDTLAVAGLLAVLALACPAWVAQQIASRAFYARGDTWRPMLLSTAVALGMIPAYLALGRSAGATGIAAAGVLGIGLNALGLLLLARRLHGAPALGPLAATLGRAFAITALAAVLAGRIQLGGVGLGGALLELAVAGGAFLALVALGVAFAGDEAMREGAARVLRRLRRRRAAA
jgi:putative peptidoglycan lipid II flippase